MTTELLVLILSALLQAVQLVLFAVPANLELGPRTTMGPRDPQDLQRPKDQILSRRTGRIMRAYDNHNEALLLFAIAAVAVTLTGTGSALTATLAWIYLAARILYVPAYAYGWVPWRSFIFGAGWIATVLMLLLALL
ncbi:MAPEG family protein [Palleronia sp. LCG004]|uniref:MAPEG family protein n=1 Tax=Palleronia sp. LCG004 TaxID=3079304 RepID=UPI00294381DF|nr:MAPEG family protein [Palleronia sp. LCG004]WOI56890.1 MAPEG family protein [Palleronia sp. LCG004]